LNRWEYARLRPRPHCSKADPAAQRTFVEHVRALHQNADVDFWFGDETGIQASPRPYVVWAKKGSKPTLPYTGEHWHQSVMGAVRPADGRFFSLIITMGNTDLFQVFLDELQRHLHPARRSILILDNVSFHKSSLLRWGRIEPLYLPPYSPELNPIEELWLHGKKRFFYHWLPGNELELEERTATALTYYMDNPALVQSVCAMTTYFRE
jgi:transposase